MQLLTFRKFNEREAAEAVGFLLHDHQIIFEVVEDSANLDSLYGDNRFRDFFVVKIQGSDFARATQILFDNVRLQVNQTGDDHYLFNFSDEELREIVYKADEWSEFDYLLARRILSERGKGIPDESIEKINNKRKHELAKPDETDVTLSYSKSWFGVFGMIIAWSMMTEKKTLPDGTRVYMYSQATRERAQLVMITSMIVTFIWLLALVGVFELNKVFRFFILSRE